MDAESGGVSMAQQGGHPSRRIILLQALAAGAPSSVVCYLINVYYFHERMGFWPFIVLVMAPGVVAAGIYYYLRTRFSSDMRVKEAD